MIFFKQDQDDSSKKIAKLAEERSKVLLEQQECLHKRKMEILKSEFQMKTEEHNEKMKILKQEAEINAIQLEILNIKKHKLMY